MVCALLFWAASRIVQSDQSFTNISYVSPDSRAYQVVGGSLPEEPSPVVVTDQRGRSKWTVSIPPTLDFPLKPAQYASICDRSMEMSQQHVTILKKPHSGQTHTHTAHHEYYYNDPHFMDIADAESHNILPGLSFMDLLNSKATSGDGFPVKHCDRSLTYALETSSAGLGSTLLGIWLAYGLSQSENRSFFIDDTNWPYGSYSTYFKPPPSPGCLPPPRTQIVPCPHQARHLLVSAATISHTFGHMFTEHFEDPKKMGVMRQHNIFALMRAGYEALFEGKLNDEDQAYLSSRIADLNSSIRATGGREIGIHIRHGDRHPLEYQYQKSYIPISKYLDTAYNLTGTTKIQASHQPPSSSRILVASDDPDVYIDPLLTSFTTTTIPNAIPNIKVEKAQSQISLASKTTLALSGTSGLGWEGGFFKDVFWALGVPSSSSSSSSTTKAAASSSKREDGGGGGGGDSDKQKQTPTTDPTTDPDPRKHPSSPPALKLREFVGRAYLLDLAVLGQGDGVVCAVSAFGCRVLGVMMGWEAVVGVGVGDMRARRRWWRNVDGDFEWRGIDW